MNKEPWEIRKEAQEQLVKEVRERFLMAGALLSSLTVLLAFVAPFEAVFLSGILGLGCFTVALFADKMEWK